jgi:hypothetical protein
VGQDSARELAGHFLLAGGMVIEGGNQGEDGGPGVRGAVHVADVNFVERSFTNTEDEGTLLFQADIGGSLDEMGGDPVGDAGQGANAAWDDDHGVCGIGTARHVGADIAIGLLVDFSRLTAQKLRDEVGAALDIEFFSDDAEAAVRSDEVDSLDAAVALQHSQELFQEQGTACAGSGDCQAKTVRWNVSCALSPSWQRLVPLK